MRRAVAALITSVVLGTVAFTAGAAQAQSAQAQSDCILDNCADKRPPVGQPTSNGNRGNVDRGNFDRGRFDRQRARPRGASQPGDFDFYVLSLSWSPGFCATGGDEKGRDQCRRGADIGFTVHGLWPQYEHGFPSDCRGQTNPPRAALASTDGVYPDQGLARYEWRRHGTCSGLSPYDYFAAVRRVRDAVAIPPRFKDPHADQTSSPADVERAFTDGNAGLRPGMITAVCSKGTLDEVRICFAKDLKSFRTCPQVMHEGCRSSTMAIPAVR